MTIYEIVGASIGIILFVCIIVTCCTLIVMYAYYDIEKHRKKDNFREVQRADMIDALHCITNNLYCINETLNKKGIKENEED